MTGPLRIQEHADRVVAVLDDPERRNAIGADMLEALHALCARLEDQPRVLLLRGAGGNFAAGADIRELRDRRRDEALRGVTARAFERVARLPMPVIALLDGYALGGGAELAYACDIRIGTPSVRLGNPEPGLGIVAGAGALWRLRELVGEPVAKEILLVGRILDAEGARSVGLLSEVVSADELEEAGHRWADRICAQSATAVRLTKAVFHAPREAHPFVDELAQAVLFETDDKYERMTAFLDRKRPS